MTNESQGKDVHGARQVIDHVSGAGRQRSTRRSPQFQALGQGRGRQRHGGGHHRAAFQPRDSPAQPARSRNAVPRAPRQAGQQGLDLLEIEREMARVRGEIDELEGRKRFWDSQVSLSTLTIQLHEPRPAIVGEGGGILGTLKSAFRQLGENLVGTIAWLIASLGVIVPAVLALWIAWRLWRALRSRRQT
ncbi:MAG: DUF4349 domain-containing protein [Desulfomicrobium escambiense]|nr:DUF4349 domain-containing protein [Desulfomicrobium escambiense]